MEHYKFFLSCLGFVVVQAALFAPVIIAIYFVVNHWMAFSALTLGNVCLALFITAGGVFAVLYCLALMLAITEGWRFKI